MSDYSVLEEPVFFATYTTGEVKEISVRTAFRDAEKKIIKREQSNTRVPYS